MAAVKPLYQDTPEDRQKMVDIVVRGLRSQGFRRSLNTWRGCAMRGVAGAKCAVGWLIPDDMYTAKMEQPYLARHLVGVEALAGFLLDLQRAHDGSFGPSDMEASLKVVVAMNGLQWPED